MSPIEEFSGEMLTLSPKFIFRRHSHSSESSPTRTPSVDSNVASSTDVISRPFLRGTARSYTSPNVLNITCVQKPSTSLRNRAIDVESECKVSLESSEEEIDVFLGGSCNPTTWRSDIALPMLEKFSVKYFNPQVDEWYEELVEKEAYAKERAKIVLIVIDSMTRSIVCVNEAVEYICRGRRVILVIEQIKQGTIIDGNELSCAEIADLNASRLCVQNLARKKEVRVYNDVRAAIEGVIKWLRTEDLVGLQRDLPRLRKRSSLMLNKWSNEFRPLRSTSRSCSGTSIVSVYSRGDSTESRDEEGERSLNDLALVEHGGGYAGSNRGFVYLGGNVKNTAWREKVAIPLLREAGIPFHVPYEDFLSCELLRASEKRVSSLSIDTWKDLEAQRDRANLILFVIPTNTRSITAMSEAVELVCSHYAMLLVIEPLQEGCQVEDGSEIFAREFKDLNRARSYLRETSERNDVEVFESVEDAISSIIKHLGK